DDVLGARPNQKHVLRDDVQVQSPQLVDLHVPGGAITAQGVQLNIDVAVRYLSAWLGGNGAVAIRNLMEDAATAEISRAQLWQWLHHNARLDDGQSMTRGLFDSLLGGIVETLNVAAQGPAAATGEFAHVN